AGSLLRVSRRSQLAPMRSHQRPTPVRCVVLPGARRHSGSASARWQHALASAVVRTQRPQLPRCTAARRTPVEPTVPVRVAFVAPRVTVPPLALWPGPLAPPPPTHRTPGLTQGSARRPQRYNRPAALLAWRLSTPDQDTRRLENTE